MRASARARDPHPFHSSWRTEQRSMSGGDRALRWCLTLDEHSGAHFPATLTCAASERPVLRHDRPRDGTGPWTRRARAHWQRRDVRSATDCTRMVADASERVDGWSNSMAPRRRRSRCRSRARFLFKTQKQPQSCPQKPNLSCSFHKNLVRLHELLC